LAAGVELHQLHYLVTLAEEVKFGRAAEREHVVQSSRAGRCSGWNVRWASVC
jgi:hypothetical protein